MNRVLIWLVVVILTPGIVISGCSAENGVPQIGKTAPDFELPALDGQAVSLRDFRGQPVMLNFWATYCDPCLYEMPIMQEALEEYADDGLVILAVDMGESPSRVKSFVEHYGFSFTVLLDTNRDISLQYNVRTIPTSFFIDKDGVMKAVKVGAFMSKIEIKRSLRTIIPQ